MGWEPGRGFRRPYSTPPAVSALPPSSTQYTQLVALVRAHALHDDAALSLAAAGLLGELDSLHPPTAAATGDAGAVAVDDRPPTPADAALTVAPDRQLEDGGSLMSAGGGGDARLSPWAALVALAAANAAAAAAPCGTAPPAVAADATLFAHFAAQVDADAAARVRAARAAVAAGAGARAVPLLRHAVAARLTWDGSSLGGHAAGKRGAARDVVVELARALASGAEEGADGDAGTPATPASAIVDPHAAADAAALLLRAMLTLAGAAEGAALFAAPSAAHASGPGGGNARAALDGALIGALFGSDAVVKGAAGLGAVLAAVGPRDARRVATTAVATRLGRRPGPWRVELDAVAAHEAAPWGATRFADAAAGPALEALAADPAGALGLARSPDALAALVAALATAGAGVLAGGGADDPRGPLLESDADARDGGARLAAAAEAAVATVLGLPPARGGLDEASEAALGAARVAAARARALAAAARGTE